MSDQSHRRRVLKPAAVVIVFLGTIALLGERIREPDRAQSAAIGLMRAINTGESSYAAAYGYYDKLECLAGTRSCVPGATSQGPFVSPDLAASRGERRGYRFELRAGPPATPARDSPISPSAMTQYAVVAVPINPHPGRYRAFCSDDRGIIYVTADGSMPRVEGGRCVDTSHTLQ